MAARKKLNMDNLKNLITMSMVYIGILLFLALVCVAVGASLISSSPAIGGMIALFGGAGFSYWAYTIATDPKNQKTCNANFFNKTENVLNPAGDDADTELEITECLAQKNAQYKGYIGVWLKSNTTTTGTFDAYYISGDSDTNVTIQPARPSDTTKGNVFIKKGTKDDPGPKVTVKSPAPSSPNP